MKARPAGITDDELRAALAKRWGLDAGGLEYSPVGAGSFHWVATDPSGTRYFVTVDGLGAKPWLGLDREVVFARLQRCYEAAARLRDIADLEFVIAPIRNTLARLNERYSVAVFPYVEGQRLGDFDTPPEASIEIVTMLARMHGATDGVRDLALTRPLGIPEREALETAMTSSLDDPWTNTAHAEQARQWLAANKEGVVRGLRAFDALAAQVKATATPVITHGEPHAGNFMRVNGALALVDWDTVALAPPERDLWLCCRNNDEAAQLYARLTGHEVDPAAMRLFTIGWELTDIATYIAYLRGEQLESEDTLLATSVLQRMDVSRLA